MVWIIYHAWHRPCDFWVALRARVTVSGSLRLQVSRRLAWVLGISWLRSGQYCCHIINNTQACKDNMAIQVIIETCNRRWKITLTVFNRAIKTIVDKAIKLTSHLPSFMTTSRWVTKVKFERLTLAYGVRGLSQSQYQGKKIYYIPRSIAVRTQGSLAGWGESKSTRGFDSQLNWLGFGPGFMTKYM